MPDLRSELIAISSSSAPVRQTDRRAATSHNEPHTRGSTLPFPHLTFCKSTASSSDSASGETSFLMTGSATDRPTTIAVTLGGARSTIDVPMLKDDELIGAFSLLSIGAPHNLSRQKSMRLSAMPARRSRRAGRAVRN